MIAIPSIIAFALCIALFFFPLQAELVQPFKIAALAAIAASIFTILGKGPFEKEEIEDSEPSEPEDEGIPAEIQAEAAVTQFLNHLQDKGRLVDFVMEDITPYSNEQIGAGARVIHQGCKEVIDTLFTIETVHQGAEQDEISFASDYDANSYRLVGKVPEQPPYNGRILHRGWKATEIRLPKLTPEAIESTARQVIAPADVEIE